MDASAYRSIFPRTRLKRSSAKDRGTLRTAEEFELVGSRGGLLSVGRDGALTGRPVDVFILDDLYKNAQEANSPLVRDHAWDWYNAVVKTRLHNELAGTARLHTLARGRPDRPDRRPGTHNGHKRSRAATGRAVLVAPTQFRGGQTGPAHERRPAPTGRAALAGPALVRTAGAEAPARSHAIRNDVSGKSLFGRGRALRRPFRHLRQTARTDDKKGELHRYGRLGRGLPVLGLLRDRDRRHHLHNGRTLYAARHGSDRTARRRHAATQRHPHGAHRK